jgi:hypothetical protein
MNMRDYPTLHLYTNQSKGTARIKKGYRCKWTWETHLHPYPFLIPAVPLL